MISKNNLLRSVALAAIAAATAKSVPATSQTKAEWPSLLLEAKDIQGLNDLIDPFQT